MDHARAAGDALARCGRPAAARSWYAACVRVADLVADPAASPCLEDLPADSVRALVGKLKAASVELARAAGGDIGTGGGELRDVDWGKALMA